jgi:hypothetical protein
MACSRRRKATYRIAIEAEGYRKELLAGTCDLIEDSLRFEAVIGRIGELAPLLGDEVLWGAYGYTTLSGPCEEEPS